MRLVAFEAVVLLAAALAGCKAQVSANLDASGKVQNDFDKPLDDPRARAGGGGFDDTIKEATLLGARQDLSFKGPATATCKCLAVAVGHADDAPFQWSGKRPSVNRESQLVIALSSSGIACPEAGAAAPGASYWGYEVAGDDVVVENAAAGRPVGSGAIIPRPLGSGQVFVRPASKAVRYGRPTAGGGERCQVGTLAPVAKASGTATPVGGVRIRTDEGDPTSTRTEIP